ncbi:unnamed protein product [Arctia plantaginis]|uniref:Uncharacterized protein n=1 Tax=Arctia plantaginis TaxID=874455 RepID=A0A8S1BVP1_ARCPL|nr:unnamed protein product [Arctia plantaginis]
MRKDKLDRTILNKHVKNIKHVQFMTACLKILNELHNVLANTFYVVGETDAGRGVCGERGGGSGGISERVRERRGAVGFRITAITGADIGSFGLCGDSLWGDKRPGDGSGVLGGSISGGRLAQGDPREPRRSFKPIGGGGEIGTSSSSAAATTTNGSVLVKAKALLTNGKVSEISDVDLRTGNSVSLSRFFGLQRSNVGSPEPPTVSEICLVRAACFIESDLERGSLVFGVGERRSPNFLLAARLIDENSPSFSGGLSARGGPG